MEIKEISDIYSEGHLGCCFICNRKDNINADNVCAWCIEGKKNLPITKKYRSFDFVEFSVGFFALPFYFVYRILKFYFGFLGYLLKPFGGFASPICDLGAKIIRSMSR